MFPFHRIAKDRKSTMTEICQVSGKVLLITSQNGNGTVS